MTSTITADPKTWQTRNCVMRRGQLRVRPGLRKVLDIAVDVVACKSVRVPETHETWHFFVLVTGDIKAYDDDFTLLFTYSATTGNVRTASFAVQADQIVITSPDFPTIHGVLGSGLERMRVKDSVNPLTTAIAPPAGVCVAWANRVVIAQDSFIFISDPQEPRTYVPQNISRIPTGSPVYGLHVSADGALIAVCATGVWALPEDAPTIGQEALQIWSKLNDHVFLDYDTSSVSRGTVWGITRDGIRQLFPQQGRELDIGVDSSGTETGLDVADEDFDDLREGHLVGGQRGLYLGIRDVTYAFDMETGFGSWWNRASTGLAVVGVLESSRGEEMLVTDDGEVLRIIGNVDGDETFTNASSVVASVILPVEVGLESDVIRWARWKHDGETDSTARAPGAAGVDGDGAYTSDASVLIESTTTFAGTTVFKSPTPIIRRAAFEVRVHGGHVTLTAIGGGAVIAPEVELDTVSTRRPSV
jgi:hypothetical protein